MIDEFRTGLDAAEATTRTEETRYGPQEYKVPVIEARHKVAMIAELCTSGWSYWLVAQAMGCTPEQAREIYVSNGASDGGLGSG